jgi:hypothetical protein
MIHSHEAGGMPSSSSSPSFPSQSASSRVLEKYLPSFFTATALGTKTSSPLLSSSQGNSFGEEQDGGDSMWVNPMLGHTHPNLLEQKMLMQQQQEEEAQSLGGGWMFGGGGMGASLPLSSSFQPQQGMGEEGEEAFWSNPMQGGASLQRAHPHTQQLRDSHPWPDAYGAASRLNTVNGVNPLHALAAKQRGGGGAGRSVVGGGPPLFASPAASSSPHASRFGGLLSPNPSTGTGFAAMSPPRSERRLVGAANPLFANAHPQSFMQQQQQHNLLHYAADPFTPPPTSATMRASVRNLASGNQGRVRETAGLFGGGGGK